MTALTFECHLLQETVSGISSGETVTVTVVQAGGCTGTAMVTKDCCAVVVSQCIPRLSDTSCLLRSTDMCLTNALCRSFDRLRVKPLRITLNSAHSLLIHLHRVISFLSIPTVPVMVGCQSLSLGLPVARISVVGLMVPERTHTGSMTALPLIRIEFWKQRALERW
jgi:hypothetical protein